MKLESFHSLFLGLLSDIYAIEKQLVNDLPMIADKAHSDELKKGINHHLEETKEHVKRLDKIFNILKETPRQMEWMGDIKKLFSDVDNFLKENQSSYLLDAAIIACAQRIEHFEIATYGTLRAFADLLDMKEIKGLLKDTLKEESHADKVLTEAATGGLLKKGINQEAMAKKT